MPHHRRRTRHPQRGGAGGGGGGGRRRLAEGTFRGQDRRLLPPMHTCNAGGLWLLGIRHFTAAAAAATMLPTLPGLHCLPTSPAELPALFCSAGEGCDRGAHGGAAAGGRQAREPHQDVHGERHAFSQEIKQVLLLTTGLGCTQPRACRSLFMPHLPLPLPLPLLPTNRSEHQCCSGTCRSACGRSTSRWPCATGLCLWEWINKIVQIWGRERMGFLPCFELRQPI